MSSNATSKNNLNDTYAKFLLQKPETSPEVSKHNKCKQMHVSRFDKIKYAVNDFDCFIISVLHMIHRHSEVSNQF